MIFEISDFEHSFTLVIIFASDIQIIIDSHKRFADWLYTPCRNWTSIWTFPIQQLIFLFMWKNQGVEDLMKGIEKNTFSFWASCQYRGHSTYFRNFGIPWGIGQLGNRLSSQKLHQRDWQICPYHIQTHQHPFVEKRRLC